MQTLRTFVRLSTLLVGLTCLCPPETAHAHHVTDGPPQGLSIASLSHGELTVVARHRAAITALAEAQVGTDPTTQRLRNYAELQRFACFWGVVPGSLTDEDSPFNECGHAFLSGYKALLLHMASMPGQSEDARALAAQINREVLADPTAGALCGWSGEVFDTAAIVGPHWSAIPTHPITVSTLLAMVLLVLGGATTAKRCLSS